MTKQKEIESAKELLFNVYKRFRLGLISKERAKCEGDLLISIIKIVELNEIKAQVKYLNNLLANNKRDK